MPQIIHQIWTDDTELRIWSVSEPLSFFVSGADFITAEDWDRLHPKRKLELAASRFLIHRHFPDLNAGSILRDEFGKLFIANSSKKLSISHSGAFTGYIISDVEIGLDIQIYIPKVIKLMPKFLCLDEMNALNTKSNQNDPLKSAVWAWSAKEAVYKAYGKRNIVFKDQIELKIPDLFSKSGFSSARLILPSEIRNYEIFYEFNDDFLWLVARLD